MRFIRLYNTKLYIVVRRDSEPISGHFIQKEQQIALLSKIREYFLCDLKCWITYIFPITEYRLHTDIVENIHKAGYVGPTPVQMQAIPIMIHVSRLPICLIQ